MTTATTTEATRLLVERLYEVVNSGRFEEFSELASPELARQFTRGVERARVGFPDLRYTVHDIVADGDRAVARWTRAGTHQGHYRGVAPTGRRVQSDGFRMYRVEGGKAVETWGTEDMLGLLRQLGAVDPSLGRAD